MEEAGRGLRKPPWIRVKRPLSGEIGRVRALMRSRRLHTVCEEASCPNLGECFSHGTATFMILGGICTRRCPFCDVQHGRPVPPDPREPESLAEVVAELGLNFVVVTSVNRDDLRDGGAGQFSACVKAIRRYAPDTRVELLLPDFRQREAAALAALVEAPPDILNHNLETVPRLYPGVRPGADYRGSLRLLQSLKRQFPEIHTKSGLMLGLGETATEIEAVLHDLLEHGCEMVTLGQYLQPSGDHLPVTRYLTPDEFKRLGELAERLGFKGVASGPLVRSSYRAEGQWKSSLSRR